MANLTLEDIEIITGDIMSLELQRALCEVAYCRCGGDETRFDEELINLILEDR
jgi:hypothetical protein